MSVSDPPGPENLRAYGILIRDGRALMSAEQVAEKPIVTVLSGPAAGVIGATEAAETAVA